MSKYSTLPWDEILKLTNGVDINGFPLSAGALSLSEVSDAKQIKELSEIIFKEAVIQIHMSGGCVVVTVNFPKTARKEYRQSKSLLENWMKNLENDSHDKEILSVTVTPLLLNGTFFLIMTNLVFFDSYDTNSAYRLIMAFDNNETIPVITDEINISQIIIEAEQQYERELNEIRMSIQEAEEEEAKANNTNPYEKSLMNQIGTFNYETADDVTSEQSGVRFIEEDDV